MPEPIANAEAELAALIANGAAPAETENPEPVQPVEGKSEDTPEKPLDEMTPEELRAYAEKVKADRDDWRSKSRTHEDMKKANYAQLQKLQEQINATKPIEQSNAEKIAALEAQIAESKKEAEILKIAKQHNLPDEAVTLLYSSTLENLPALTETVVALVSKMASEKAAAPAPVPSLPINPNQAVESKAQGLSGAELEMQALLKNLK
jgi:hypothetical protein